MKTSISFLVFICAALVIWWSLTTTDKQDETLPSARKQPFIEIFMNDFKITALNSFGKADYTLTGERLERYNNSNNAIITQPVFNFLQENSRWLITADKATVNEKRNLITLTDNVVMQQQQKPQAILIRSELMYINTAQQTAYTRTAVDIRQGQSRIQSIGMTYNNKRSKLVLKSDVHGYYLETSASVR